jgi:hypothetical protein
MASRRRREALLLASFALIPLLNFPLALVGNRALFLRDVSMVWAPQIEAVVRQVGEGRLPAWDEWRAFGQPLFADPRAEVLYPPAWIHWIVPAEKSYALFCAFHLLIAAVGAARLARRLFPGAGLGAELVAGIAFSASGPVLSLVSHWHHLAAAAWMPWIVERAAVGPDGKTPWLSLSLLTALQVLAGSPDYTFATFLCCGLLLVTRSDTSPRSRAGVVVVLLLGLVIAAVQLVPAAAWFRATSRDAFPVGWAVSPLPPTLTVETVVPVRVAAWPLRSDARDALFHGWQVWMFSHYLGLTVWALALLGLRATDRPTRRFALTLVILGLLLATGVREPWAQSIVSRVPVVSGLHFPSKHLVSASLGLSLLAASGAAAIESWRRRDRAIVLVGAGGALAWCAWLYVHATAPEAPFDPSVSLPPAAALAAFTGLLLTRGSRRAGIAWALVAFDLLSAGRHLNPTIPATFFRERPPLAAALPEGSRLYVSDYSINVRGRQVRFPESRPYELARVPQGYSQAEAVVLAATWYLNPPSAGRFGFFGSFDLDILDFYRAPLKRVVEGFVTSRDPATVLRDLRRGSVDYVVTMDPRSLWRELPLVREDTGFFEAPVRVFRVPDPWPLVRLETKDGELLGERPAVLVRRSGAFDVKATPSTDSRLVVAEAYDAGWTARVDGHAAAVTENDMAFLSVPLGPGEHRVELTYRPRGLLAGAIASALGLCLAVGLEVRSRRVGSRLGRG